MGSSGVVSAKALEEFQFELLPLKFRELWAKVDPRYLEMTELQLRAELRRNTGPLQEDMPLLIRMRIAFWEEYERSAILVQNGAPADNAFDIRRIIRIAGRGQSYWACYDRYPALLPWVLCPLAGIFLERRELEFLAQERMFEILANPAVKPDGKTDSRLAKIQFEIYRELQDRIHGPVVQKIQSEQKNLNVNVEANAEQASRAIGMITDVSELDRRIAEVRQKQEALKTLPQPVVIDQQKLMLQPDTLDAELVEK
jgi:hypothetical protein